MMRRNESNHMTSNHSSSSSSSSSSVTMMVVRFVVASAIAVMSKHSCCHAFGIASTCTMQRQLHPGSTAASLSTCLSMSSTSTATTEASSSSSPPKIELSPGEVDYEALLKESTFPISPTELIERAKEVLGPDVGIGTKDDGKCLANDFEFCAAVVGPIPKEVYLEALGNFQLEDSFDISQNFFGFVVDPFMMNRVYFFSRQRATFNGKPFLGKDSDNSKLFLPPQCLHLDFTPEGQVKEFGFYTVDRRQGNTGGLGGAFGYMYGIDRPLPIPECHPYKPSFRFWLLNKIGSIGRRLKRNKK